MRGERYLLTDLLGSTVALTDRLGHVVTTHAYSPFGATGEAGPPSNNPVQTIVGGSTAALFKAGR